MDSYNTRADSTYALVKNMTDDGYEFPHTLYVKDTSSHTQKRTYTLQFLLKNYQIIPSEPEEAVEEAIVFCSDANYETLLSQGYVYTPLDGNEFLYVKGDPYLQMFEEYGLTFSEPVENTQEQTNQ